MYQLHDVVFDTIVQLPLSHFSVADPEQEPLSDIVTELPDEVLETDKGLRVQLLPLQ